MTDTTGADNGTSGLASTAPQGAQANIGVMLRMLLLKSFWAFLNLKISLLTAAIRILKILSAVKKMSVPAACISSAAVFPAVKRAL